MGPLLALLVSFVALVLVIGVSFCIQIAVYLKGEGGDIGPLILLAVIGVALLGAMLGWAIRGQHKR